MCCAKRDKDKIAELNQQLIKVAKREEMARKELAEKRKSVEPLAAEKLRTVQKEKMDLEAALDKVDVFLLDLSVFVCYFCLDLFNYNWPLHCDVVTKSNYFFHYVIVNV